MSQKSEKKNSGINLHLDKELALTFNYFRSLVSNDRKKRASNVDVMIALFQAMKEKRVMESKMKSLQSKIDHLNGDIMVLLRESINRPINIQVGALAQATQISPGPPRLPPKHIVPISQNIRDDLKVELESVFDGEIPKPSLIKMAVEESEEKENE